MEVLSIGRKFVTGIISLMLLIPCAAQVTGTPVFSDNFDDNTKDHTKWTECDTSGTWEEINQRTELLLYESGNSTARFEGIEGSEFAVSLSSTEGIVITWDMVTNIGSTGSVGHVWFEVTDGVNWIRASYWRDHNTTKFWDSNDGSYTNLNISKSDGSWSNEMRIFRDRYQVTMDADTSPWVDDIVFSCCSSLRVRIYLEVGGSNADLYTRCGFDELVVETTDTIFYDDFADDLTDTLKWTETDSAGTWEEVNQRTELQLYESGTSTARFECIEGCEFTASLSPSEGINVSCDMITNIGSTGSVGHVWLEVTNGTDSIRAAYWRWPNDTRFRDSNDDESDYTILETGKSDGTWPTEILIFSNRYLVRIDGVTSGWVYDAVFPPDPTLRVKVSLEVGGTNPGYYTRSGFDNVVVRQWQSASCCLPPIRGNVNYDLADVIDISDLVYLVDYMFSGGPAPECVEEANIDGSCCVNPPDETLDDIDIADLVYLVDYMFVGGPDPLPCP